MLAPVFVSLILALGLGLLVGLERERVDSHLAGLRTFPLITMMGVISALLADRFGGWVMAAGLVALAAAVVIGDILAAQDDRRHSGITTEIAIFVMYLVGALLHTAPLEVGVVVGAGVAVLLHAKPVLRSVMARFAERDVRAIMQFALVTLVILPVLPNQTYGPFDVLNPRQIWFMVVLVVGVSLGGYVAQRLLGGRASAVLGGALGGVISSTATTVSFARRSRGVAGFDMLGVLVILIAGTMTYGRVLLEIFVVGRDVFRAMAWPLAILLLVAVGLSTAAWLKARGKAVPMPTPENPAEFKTALAFAALYAVVLFLAAAAADLLGERSVYLVAVVSGATDMDAITLSTTRLAVADRIDTGTAWRAVVLATISNLTFKAGVVWALGTPRLARWVTAGFGVQALVGAGLIVLWPG